MGYQYDTNGLQIGYKCLNCGLQTYNFKSEKYRTCNTCLNQRRKMKVQCQDCFKIYTRDSYYNHKCKKPKYIIIN